MPPTTPIEPAPAPTVRKHRPAASVDSADPPAMPAADAAVPEIGGRKDGTDPTRYGDWEKNGRCVDF